MHLDETLTYFPLPFLFSNSTFLSPMPTPKHFYLFTCFCSPMSSAMMSMKILIFITEKKRKKKKKSIKKEQHEDLCSFPIVHVSYYVH